MRLPLATTCFWPGLPQLWRKVRWLGLLQATGFAVLLNVTLATTFLWPHVFPQAVPWVGWSLVIGLWLVSTWRSVHALPRGFEGERGVAEDNDKLFLNAQAEYLQGHWFEAEAILVDLVKRNPQDIESRLLLATMYRHTGQLDQATEQLKRLDGLEGAERWREEIEQERSLLKRNAGKMQAERAQQAEAA